MAGRLRKAKTKPKSRRRLVVRNVALANAYEYEEARSVQRAMIPSEPLRDRSVEVQFRFRPVAEVGGDFLDYFWLANGRLGFFMGDVVGKGLPAALFGALTVGILRGINKGGGSPTSVLEFLNRRLLDRAVPNRYCSVQYAVFDPASLEITLANAGLRPRPIHISAAGCREMEGAGFPCGLFRHAQYGQVSARLASGDSILFSTDGLIEAQNFSGEEFGIERLLEVCRKNSKGPPATLLYQAFQAVDEFVAGAPQFDDMTAAVLHLD